MSKSAWRFQLALSAEAASSMSLARGIGNALYDSLASASVRGMQFRPYGADLETLELDDFFAEVASWYDAIADSLAGLDAVRPVLDDRDFRTPQEFLSLFESLASTEIPAAGDVFLLETSKPFDRDDVLRFDVTGNELAGNIDESVLDEIIVVPDPYVAVNPLESRNVLLSGRGERRIDFRNLPPECTIRIFTVSGRLVKTINHQSAGFESTAMWNLQSDDGLDVSYGVYVYHVEAPGIGERIGRFSIIK